MLPKSSVLSVLSVMREEIVQIAVTVSHTPLRRLINLNQEDFYAFDAEKSEVSQNPSRKPRW